MKLFDRKISRRVFVEVYTPSTEDQRKNEENWRNIWRKKKYEERKIPWPTNHTQTT